MRRDREWVERPKSRKGIREFGVREYPQKHYFKDEQLVALKWIFIGLPQG